MSYLENSCGDRSRDRTPITVGAVSTLKFRLSILISSVKNLDGHCQFGYVSSLPFEERGWAPPKLPCVRRLQLTITAGRREARRRKIRAGRRIASSQFAAAGCGSLSTSGSLDE
jgi:hypothetical protein